MAQKSIKLYANGEEQVFDVHRIKMRSADDTSVKVDFVNTEDTTLTAETAPYGELFYDKHGVFTQGTKPIINSGSGGGVPEGGAAGEPWYDSGVILGSGDILIRWIDFDGRIIQQNYCKKGDRICFYRREGIQADVVAPNMSEHPLNKPFLTFTGWNHRLYDFENYDLDTAEITRPLDIGAEYTTDITDDEGNVLAQPTYVEIDVNPISGLAVEISFFSTGEVTINFGDGSADEFFQNEGEYFLQHVYESAGTYLIRFDFTKTMESSEFALGNQYYRFISINNDENSDYFGKQVHDMNVYLGSNVDAIYADPRGDGITYVPIHTLVLSSALFGTHISHPLVKHITFPRGVEGGAIKLPTYAEKAKTVSLPAISKNISQFSYWRTLERVCCMDNKTHSDDTLFDRCFNLDYTEPLVVSSYVPNNIVSLFAGNKRIKKLIIDSEQNISFGGGCFSSMTALREIHIKKNDAIIPLLAHPWDGEDAVFLDVPRTLKVYVPPELVDGYKADDNWSEMSLNILPNRQ